MAAFGVESTFGVTAPSGYLQSSEESVDVEVATIKSAVGQVVVAQAKPRSITTVTVKTKGNAVLGTVASGGMSGMAVTGTKYSQTNDDFSTSEVTGTHYQ
jgi:hypothetical protein